MRIKGVDGILRNFEVSKMNLVFCTYSEAKCKKCGFKFGVHDTKFLIPEFKKHICKKEENG